MTAGRVGKPHGLDGSFYVEGARHELPEGTRGHGRREQVHAVERRAGTDERPLIRLAGIDDPRPLRGETLLVEDELDEGEWLAADLVGCAVPGLGTVDAGASTAPRAPCSSSRTGRSSRSSPTRSSASTSTRARSR